MKPLMLHSFAGHLDHVSAVALISDDVCVSGSRDFFVSIYDLKDFRRRATFDFEGAVSVLALSHDKKHVIEIRSRRDFVCKSWTMLN